MEYHGNHYFTDVKIGVLHEEGLMSHTLLNLTKCYIKTCYFRQMVQTVPILSKWVGYIDPSFLGAQIQCYMTTKVSFNFIGHFQTNYHSIVMNVIKFNIDKKKIFLFVLCLKILLFHNSNM